MDLPFHTTPTYMRCLIITDLALLSIHQTRQSLCKELKEMPSEHRRDRASQQYVGETKAWELFELFTQFGRNLLSQLGM